MSDSFCDRLSYHDKKDRFIAVACKKHACDRYQMIEGRNPQTGETIAHWDCAYNWTNMLLVENSQRQLETAAAVTELKNETVGGQVEIVKFLTGPANMQLGHK
ncbi:hypothetical protein [Dasania marina]|uniref:hypothetical protein n=1 Tax=Dasania marina TaxID=471499 RepID=UPI00036076C1|nr:hypothetical protein [Dasania marina]